MQKQVTTKRHAGKEKRASDRTCHCLQRLSEEVMDGWEGVSDLPAPVREQIERLYIHWGGFESKQFISYAWRPIIKMNAFYFKLFGCVASR